MDFATKVAESKLIMLQSLSNLVDYIMDYNLIGSLIFLKVIFQTHTVYELKKKKNLYRFISGRYCLGGGECTDKVWWCTV